MTVLPSVGLIVTVLGGSKKVAQMLHTTPKAISNWKVTDQFPANSYVAVQRRLKEMGFVAPDSLWPMKDYKKKARMPMITRKSR